MTTLKNLNCVELLSPAVEVLVSYFPSHQLELGTLGFILSAFFFSNFITSNQKLLSKSYQNTKKEQGVCHTVGLLTLKAKEELQKPQIFHHAKV
jgi:uncharacterized BrkB/YihY/UPF0761 family membrane protein